MNAIFLASAVFLGFVIGIIIVQFTKEEFSSNKKYFILFKNFLIILLSIILIYFNKSYNYWYLYFLIGIPLGYFLRVIFLYLGVILNSMLYSKPDNLLLVSSIIFLFGLVYGSFKEEIKRKIIIKLIVLNYIIFIIPIISVSNSNPTIPALISSGALIGNTIYSSFIISSNILK